MRSSEETACRQGCALGTAGRRDDRRAELAEAGPPQLEREAETLRGPPRGRDELRVVRLGEIHEPSVVAEVDRQELRMAVEPEPADDESVRVADEEVGEE